LTEERNARRNKEQKKNLSSPGARPGEEEEETVPPKNSIVLLFPFFFFGECIKRRRFSQKHAVSFKWKLSPKCLRFQVSPSICALFSLVLGFVFL
jgi:hypothetical protein